MKYFKILVFLISYICIHVNSQCATGAGNPVTSYDCLKNGDNTTNYCCMLSSPGYNPNTQMCYQLPVSSYVGQKLYQYNNLTWNMNCGNPTVTPIKGGPCGNSNPVHAFDCWQFSDYSSSCCLYYSGNTTGTPGCQWLGNKKSGNTTSDSQILLECSSIYLICGLINLLILALVLLF